jgi:hypothetical protein
MSKIDNKLAEVRRRLQLLDEEEAKAKGTSPLKRKNPELCPEPETAAELPKKKPVQHHKTKAQIKDDWDNLQEEASDLREALAKSGMEKVLTGLFADRREAISKIIIEQPEDWLATSLVEAKVEGIEGWFGQSLNARVFLLLLLVIEQNQMEDIALVKRDLFSQLRITLEIIFAKGDLSKLKMTEVLYSLEKIHSVLVLNKHLIDSGFAQRKNSLAALIGFMCNKEALSGSLFFDSSELEFTSEQLENCADEKEQERLKKEKERLEKKKAQVEKKLKETTAQLADGKVALERFNNWIKFMSSEAVVDPPSASESSDSSASEEEDSSSSLEDDVPSSSEEEEESSDSSDSDSSSEESHRSKRQKKHKHSSSKKKHGHSKKKHSHHKKHSSHSASKKGPVQVDLSA